MEAPKYLIAKFTPDLFRMEPKNIGIILFHEGTIAARFIGEREKGTFDQRKVPDFLRDKEAYGLWISFWRKQLVKAELAPIAGGESAKRATPEFLEALRTYSRGNYSLEDGGQILDSIRDEEFRNVLDYLYDTLVQESPHESGTKTVKMFCDEALNSTSLRNHTYFKEDYSITATRKSSANERFHFEYAIANGTPKKLYKLLALARKETSIQTSIDATLWAFDSLRCTFDSLKTEDCVALLLLHEDGKDKDFLNSRLSILNSYAKVLNVRNTSELASEFRAAETITI